MRFPTPPPLKQKPSREILPVDVRRAIPRPERLTHLCIASGVLHAIIGALLAWLLIQLLRFGGISISFRASLLLILLAIFFGFQFGARVVYLAIRSLFRARS